MAQRKAAKMIYIRMSRDVGWGGWRKQKLLLITALCNRFRLLVIKWPSPCIITGFTLCGNSSEVTVARVWRCQLPNPMIPCWTRQQLPGNALVWHNRGKERKKKSAGFFLCAWITELLTGCSWGYNEGLTTGTAPVPEYKLFIIFNT